MHYFKQVKSDKIVSVESKSINVVSPDFVKATKAEYDNFLASLPIIEPELTRNLAAEVDEIKVQLAALSLARDRRTR